MASRLAPRHVYRLNEGSFDHLSESGPAPRVLASSRVGHVSTRLIHERAQTLPTLGRNANSRCADVITCRCRRQHGRTHSSVISQESTKQVVPRTDVTKCFATHSLVLLQDIFRRRHFSLALRRSRMARFVDVSIGITPRNVRSDGLAPCK